MAFRIVGFSGSFSQPSRTRALVDLALGRAAQIFGATTVSHGLSDLQPQLGTATRLEDLHSLPRAIVASILSADALIVGSPIYKGSYGGLFKHLFDLIDPAALAGKPVLLIATGGGARHALVVEHQLRPLFGFFEAAVLPTGLYASAADFAGETPVAVPLLERLDRAVDQFAPWLTRQKAVQAA
ncbi:NAD(P)H-dependent oxidoreductase [Neotabrizicola sp. sgz301269]|uniref:NAD(P)H-dependent oxidoreductase n=1 Tax=Neotabrizicola sp. sgz301269 TaxID=3276282 RepID=UPI0037704101